MRIFLLSACALFILQGCDLFDKEEDIPGFIYIDSADLVTIPETEGANTNGIVDVHAFANGQYLGAYELPANIPVYASGTTTFTLSAGIKNNGLAANRIIYPFYANTYTDVTLIPGVSVPVTADSAVTFQYFHAEGSQPDPLRFQIEDFEWPGNVWIPAEEDSVGVINTTEPAFVRTGLGGGKVLLDEARTKLTVYSSLDSWDLSDIPPAGVVYLEIDFKGDVPMLIGVRTVESVPRNIFALGLNATPDWAKVYVELSDEIHGAVNISEFQIYLYAEKPTTLGQATIALDNIKVVYPK